jgi:RNA methyltransferase, TrmH family
VLSARKLTTRRGRRAANRFLAEGAQPVLAALAAPGAVVELFATAEALERLDGLAAAVQASGLPCDLISAKAAAALSETVHPQGVIAVCRQLDLTLASVLAKRPRLVAALVEASDPGNAGTIIRTADAAGAAAVVFVGGVDPFGGKTVRASAGSLFNVDIVCGIDAAELLAQAARAGLTSLATTAVAARDIEQLALDATLARPTLWLFGNEAHGLPEAVLESADERVRVPIYGHAESLNLAVAAGVCLYASARAQHGQSGPA